MEGIARIGDFWVGVCCCHDDPTCINMTGQVITGSYDCKSNGLGQGRMTDLVMGHCGHFGTIISGSNKSITNGLAKGIVTSQTTGCLTGTIVSGSSNHSTG